MNYELTIKVRDYEVDSQGIVNNANYLHYLEITRHDFANTPAPHSAPCRNRGLIRLSGK